jgi:hypothetical protein
VGGPPMIRDLARILWELARGLPDPEKHPQLRPLALHVIGLYGRPAHATTPEEWEEALLDAIAQRITDKWDRYGAPSAARDPQGEGYIASFEGPGDPVTVKAESKREAYKMARKLWIKRLLDEP